MHLSTNVLESTLILMKAETGDKTFLLIIIFTLAWSTWHLKEDMHDEEKEHQHQKECDHKEEPLKEGGDDE